MLEFDRYIKSQKQFILNGGDMRNQKQTRSALVDHPVNAYLLVRRLTADWEDIQMSLHAISNYSTGKIHSEDKL